ncbi:spinster family MFS transporter [Sphingosinicella humi]|uniref:MFS transporter n=1 Tax=Allosphingosinicella humi TaxID=2068657 RepID=A0A2U2J6J4_9SPHN|nr:MFS transporter [Sphingosinicella humi]PWG03965.1 MFS transporter [Sphingosinicella humi]
MAATSGRRVLAILLLAYIFNFLDRQIVSILAEPIKKDLGLTDGQLGLMGGLAFALFYTGLGIPIAWLADRKSRVTIISVSLALWSGFTALCGFAGNFWQLFLARMGVGVGEAGGVAPSYALISDSFPPNQRGRALAIFSFGIPIGSALGIFFGGWIASNIDWRAAFIIVGLAGLFLAPLVKFGVPEAPRGGFDEARTEEAASLAQVGRILSKKPSFWLLSFGSACSSVIGYGFAFWLPSFLARSHGLDLVDRSLFYGTIALIGGLAGVWMGGWLGDKAGATDPGGYARVPAYCFLLAIPLYAVGLFAPSLLVTFLLLLVPTALALAWLGPGIAAIQQVVPPQMRATASAIFLFVNNLIGIGFGTWFLGFMSDSMAATYGEDSLRYSMIYGLAFYLAAATLYLTAARRLNRDWYRG